jgi:hypothetical protein
MHGNSSSSYLNDKKMKTLYRINVDIRDDKGNVIRDSKGNKVLGLDWEVTINYGEHATENEVLERYLRLEGNKLQTLMPEKQIELYARYFNGISNTWSVAGMFYISENRLIL